MTRHRKMAFKMCLLMATALVITAAPAFAQNAQDLVILKPSANAATQPVPIFAAEEILLVNYPSPLPLADEQIFIRPLTNEPVPPVNANYEMLPFTDDLVMPDEVAEFAKEFEQNSLKASNAQEDPVWISELAHDNDEAVTWNSLALPESIPPMDSPPPSNAPAVSPVPEFVQSREEPVEAVMYSMPEVSTPENCAINTELVKKLAILEREKELLRQRLNATVSDDLAPIMQCASETDKIKMLEAQIAYLKEENQSLKQVSNELLGTDLDGQEPKAGQPLSPPDLPVVSDFEAHKIINQGEDL